MIPRGNKIFQLVDYAIHVFEVAWFSDEQIAKFTSDFKVVANLFAKKRRNKNYIPNDTTEIKHVDETLKLLRETLYKEFRI